MQEASTVAEYESLIGGEGCLVGYFSTPECRVCKVLRPKVAEMAEGAGVEAVYVDTTKLPSVAGQLVIFSVPTVVVFVEGRERWRFGRHLSLDDLASAMEAGKQMAEEGPGYYR